MSSQCASKTMSEKNIRYVPSKLQLFLTTATTFSTLVYTCMSNNFLDDFFKRNLAVLCEVIEGLKNNKI